MAATGVSSHNAAREARRRRILERGSDRLALITGQIHSLPPDPQSTSSADPTLVSEAASDRLLLNEETVSERTAPDEMVEETVSDHTAPDETVEETVSEFTAPDETVEPSLHMSQNGRNISSKSVSQIPSSTQRPAEDLQRNLLTTGKIRSAIAASENARMLCSVAAAVLVIASYMGSPLGGFMVLRPVYLLLLTNTTIVLGRAILGAQGTDARTGRRRIAPPVSGGNALADQLGKALELGLLMQKISGALFMDFSIYAVMLVSGLSLLHKLGL